jgi:hypothetical protein
MKRTLLSLFFIAFYSISFSASIDSVSAKKVGQSFLMSRTGAFYKSEAVLNLAYVEKSSVSYPNAKLSATPLYYVFNVANGPGFIIVSADDRTSAVLGYSNDNNFKTTGMAPHVAKWLEGYKNQISYAIQNNTKPTQAIASEWQGLLSGNPVPQAYGKTAGAVSPLIQTIWNQAPYYNLYCPYDSVALDQAVTGCVATAMAQVMKFWNYPASGFGFHTYNHPKYGTLSANFANTTYDWSSMPNDITANNYPIATLMYHCGVSLDMNYDVAANGGSGAYTSAVATSLKEYFGYAQSTKAISRKNYTDLDWVAVLKAELDSGRPMEYAGAGTHGGHAFVCDGYDINTYFHFNWGWGGNSDGYFKLDALNPGSLGAGGGTGGYNTNQQAIIGVKPVKNPATYMLDITANVVPSAPTINFGAGFSVSTNITNIGTNSFSGDFAAALFDKNGIFIDFVGTNTGFNLAPGATPPNSIDFTKAGSYGLLPGTYKINIYFRPTGGGWKELQSSNVSVNGNTSITVVNVPNALKLYAPIKVAPLTLVQGQSASVTVNLYNANTYTYFGQYEAVLYDINGTLIETLGTYVEKNGLAKNSSYPSPFLTFSKPSLAAKPGTYVLVIEEKDTTATTWHYAGADLYANHIQVKVIKATLSPDVYEVNNVYSQASNLPFTFVNDTARQTTIGSNLHIGTDYDYYKFELPTGYDYTIKARIHDMFSSGNGLVYTVDGVVSYSTDGVTWSSAFDDIISDNILIKGGGTAGFLVSPIYTGETGTYLLDATISRQAIVTGLESSGNNGNNISVFPNPAKDNINLNLQHFSGEVYAVSLVNLHGQKIKTIENLAGKNKISLATNGIAAGFYYLQIETNTGLVNKKVVLQE